jgi:GNAT superfamily N-acetyltransferase
MDQDTIEFVAFGEAHLDAAHGLSLEAGWPHRREDWAMLLRLSHGFVAVHGETVVGTAMLTPFGDHHAAINMVIVAAGMRGRGLGRKLMDAALRVCGERECRLTATEDGLPLYEKLGFRATHEIRQHQGVPASLPSAPKNDRFDLNWADADDFTAVAGLDLQALGTDRRPLLRLLADAGRILVLREAGTVTAYAALRPFGRGEVIGPLIAATPGQAWSLLDVLIDSRPGVFLRVDTPEWQQLSPWLSSRGLVGVGGGIAMSRNATGGRSLGPAKPFALASQALG